MGNRSFELKSLAKWETALNNCIRCGYCYEHCPLVKHTGWESDSPRAKLIMLFGMLAKKLEPSKYIAEKVFSCFNCGRCVAACSSGVPILDIFTDARKAFAGTEFEMSGTTSTTDPGCALCLSCVRGCPHEARSFKDSKIITDIVKCQSCGICVEVCPNNSVQTAMGYGTNREELNNKALEFLKKKNSKAIIFGCNWSYYPDLQSASIQDAKELEYKILINMCGGRVERQLLLEPFLEKSWGVLVACCPDGECKHGGNLKAKSHVKALQTLFKEIDINPERLQIVQIAHGDKAGFQTEINNFMKKINELGPLK